MSGSSTAVSRTTGTKANRSRRRCRVSSPRPSGRVRSRRTRSGVSVSPHAAPSVSTCLRRQSHPSGDGLSAAPARCACTGSSSTRRMFRVRCVAAHRSYRRTVVPGVTTCWSDDAPARKRGHPEGKLAPAELLRERRITAMRSALPSKPIPGSSGRVTWPSSTRTPSGKPPKGWKRSG